MDEVTPRHIDAIKIDYHEYACKRLAKIRILDETIAVERTPFGEDFSLPSLVYNQETDRHATPKNPLEYAVALGGLKSSVLQYTDPHSDQECDYDETNEVPFGEPAYYDGQGRAIS